MVRSLTTTPAQELVKRYTFGEPLLAFFTRADCQVTSVDRHDTPEGHDLWMTVRLPVGLEQELGLDRPLVVLCSTQPAVTFDVVRTLRNLVRSAGGQVEPEVALLATPDARANERLTDLGTQRSLGLAAVPLVTVADARLRDGALSESLRDLLAESLFGRDLYDERLPVTGESFFGRARELAAVTAAVLEGNHVGLFGLRKIGKTSLLYAIRDQLRKRTDVLPVYVDLQSSAAQNDAAHTAWEAGQQLKGEVKTTDGLPITAEDITRHLRLPARPTDHPSHRSIGDFWTGISAVLTALPPQYRLVLILDEAEVFYPPAGGTLPGAAQFVRGLRAASHHTSRVSLVLAGVNSTPCDRPTLAGVDNPLFGLLSVLHLGPLTKEDCREMIKITGRKIGLRWVGESATALTEAVGHHPSLARLAASDIAAADKVRPREIRVKEVTAALQDFPSRHNARFLELFESLRRYYPEELEILRVAASGDTEFLREWHTAEPEHFNHLVSYGILDGQHRVRIPVLKRWLDEHPFVPA